MPGRTQWSTSGHCGVSDRQVSARMIDWQYISTTELATLAQLALQHGMCISEMLRNLHKLSDDERAVVERVIRERNTTHVM